MWGLGLGRAACGQLLLGGVAVAERRSAGRKQHIDAITGAQDSSEQAIVVVSSTSAKRFGVVVGRVRGVACGMQFGVRPFS